MTLAPDSAVAWAGAGNAYAQAGQQDASVAAYAKSLELNPRAAGVHMSHGHALKTIGDQEAALAAYRAAVAERPRFGEVFWSMANLKVFRFEDAEVRTMAEQLTRGDLTDSERIHFSFGLGKAYEDKGDYEAAWSHYDAGNRLQRPLVKHDPLELEKRHQDIRAIFDRDFLARHAGSGHEAPDPILIVGLPRSGSTLVEQILASHSQVEGTAELPALGQVATSIGRFRRDDVQFPGSVVDLDGRDWRAYGQRYLEDAARHRFTGRQFFTDKMPNNFPLLGLLHLILPNAKIIDARRHPLDSCLGCYKQLFAKGQNFTYDLEDLAHYYRHYHATMDHWHDVLPGRVLTVHYEDTVIDLEGQVRRILEHCRLPFEAGCVRFFETRRAVRTASSEQVRHPSTATRLARGGTTPRTSSGSPTICNRSSMRCRTRSRVRMGPGSRPARFAVAIPAPANHGLLSPVPGLTCLVYRAACVAHRALRLSPRSTTIFERNSDSKRFTNRTRS